MAKEKIEIPDAELLERGPGIWDAKYFNPTKKNEDGTEGAWEMTTYIDGFAQAKLGIMHKRKMGKARFKNLRIRRSVSQKGAKW